MRDELTRGGRVSEGNEDYRQFPGTSVEGGGSCSTHVQSLIFAC